jgi:hypothetical protein
LEFRLTIPPPDPLSVTVHEVVESGDMLFGLQAIALIVVSVPPVTLTAPPVPVRTIASPIGEAPRVLLTVTGAEPFPDRVTVMVATTPLGMAVEFGPHATQV